MSNLLLILVCVSCATLIWKLRQQSEHAAELIGKHCDRLNLQLLSVSRSQFNFKLGKDFLQASFIFEFSSDSENSYQGKLYLSGLHRARFELPVYRTLDDETTFH